MMKRPYDMYRKGGLKDEGGEIDPVSGNEVPVGGTKKGVRDDIPVNLSEGEFVMPEDATRYHGLKTMMQLRQEAKMGLKQMEAMGLMGNAEEATLPDDLPFGMDDLVVIEVEDKERKNMAVGGVTTSADTGTTGGGVRVEGSTTQRPDTSAVAPAGEGTQFRQLTTSPIPTRLSIPDFKDYMAESFLEFKEYRNEDGKSLLVPFIGGKPLYPIPDGYVLYSSNALPDDPVAGGGSSGSGSVDTGAVDPTVGDTSVLTDRGTDDGGDRLFEGEDDQGPDPVDWGSLSDEELLDQASDRLGLGRTIVEGVITAINPLAGLAAKGLMSLEDKAVLEELQRRANTGNTMFDEIIGEYQNKNKGILNKAVGSVVDLFNNTFNKPQEEVAQNAAILAEANIPVATQKNDEGFYDPIVVQSVADTTQSEYEEAAFGSPTPEEVVMAQPVEPARTPEEVVMAQPVVPAAPSPTPEEVVMAQPVVPAAPTPAPAPSPTPEETVMAQPVVPATPSPTPAPTVQTPDEQMQEVFTPTVTTTTGTGTGRDTADMPVTAEQQTYASAAQEREDPFDPRNITRVPTEQTTNIPVTTTAQVTAPTLQYPQVDVKPAFVPTPTSDPQVVQTPPTPLPAPSDDRDTFMGFEEEDPRSQGSVSPEEVVMSQPVAPATPTPSPAPAITEYRSTFSGFESSDPRSQGAPTLTPEEVVMSQPVAPAAPAREDTYTQPEDRDNNVASSGRTETEIQNDINSALSESGGEWTSELNDLVSERDSARANEGSSRDNDNDGGGGGGGGGGKIVCTAMNNAYGFGQYRNSIWLAYSARHMTKEHEVGYHTIFLPLIDIAYKKKYNSVRVILENIARHRTADLRAEMKNGKRDTLGRIYRTILEPICYVVGKVKLSLEK